MKSTRKGMHLVLALSAMATVALTAPAFAQTTGAGTSSYNSDVGTTDRDEDDDMDIGWVGLLGLAGLLGLRRRDRPHDVSHNRSSV